MGIEAAALMGGGALLGGYFQGKAAKDAAGNLTVIGNIISNGTV